MVGRQAGVGVSEPTGRPTGRPKLRTPNWPSYPTYTARKEYGWSCELCPGLIVAGDRYVAAGQRRAHAACVDGQPPVDGLDG